METPSAYRKVSIKQYIYGDFDKDKTANIDDPKPFDPKISKYPNIKKRPTYYHHARYGGTDVKLSTILRTVERSNNHQRKLFNKFLRENPQSIGRIKTVPSTLKKLYDDGYKNLFDIAGVKVIRPTRQHVYEEVTRLKNRYSTDASRNKNFYLKPRETHRGVHLGIQSRGNRRLEVQVQTLPFKKLDDRVHRVYKSDPNAIPKKLIRRAEELQKLGF